MTSQRKYIVYITHYRGTKLPSFYIGSSYKEKVLNGYNGSVGSKKWKSIYKSEQENNKHLFRTKILSYHSSSKEALEEELRLQKLHLVVKNNKYFNESYAQPDGYAGRDVKGKLNPNFGKRWSVKQKNDRINYLNKTVLFEGSVIKIKTRNAIKRGRQASQEKHKETINSLEWKETVGKVQQEKRIKSKEINFLKKCDRYNILKDGIILEENVTLKYINNIRELKKKTKEDYFGKNKNSAKMLKNKTYIGCYIIKIKDKE